MRHSRGKLANLTKGHLNATHRVGVFLQRCSLKRISNKQFLYSRFTSWLFIKVKTMPRSTLRTCPFPNLLFKIYLFTLFWVAGHWGGGEEVVHYLPLCAWWWDIGAVLQESVAQPEVLPWGEGPSSSRRMQTFCYRYSSRGVRTLPQGCAVASWLLRPVFCIPSLMSNFWICPLELREGKGGSIKPISYEQETGDIERLSYLGEPRRNLLGFLNSLFIMEQLDSNCFW